MLKFLYKTNLINFLLKLKIKIYPYFRGLILYLKFNKPQFTIYIPKIDIIDNEDNFLANRIFESYKKMKIKQIEVKKIYKPSSLWQKIIDQNFSHLNNCIKNNNLKEFLFLLQNFGNWKTYLGIENQDLIKKYSKNIFLKKFLEEDIFNAQKKIWKYFNSEKDISSLNMPKYGNQNGALINNNFVVIGSFFNHIYAEIVAKYIINSENNSIVDLGGGYGKLAYYILHKVKKFNFVDFDIPEVLILANYYLAKSFPNKKVFFYGEKKFENDQLKKYDLLFLPNWEIEKIQSNSIKITINRNSLGEMDAEAAKNYIYHIHRISEFFFSMNHETFKNRFNNNEYSLVNKDFNSDNKFFELIRYPDLGHLTYETNKINLNMDIFFYLYKKK